MKPADILYWFPQETQGPMTLGSTSLAAVPERLRSKFGTHTMVAGSQGPDPSRRGLLITWQEAVQVTYQTGTHAWRRVGDYWVGIRQGYAPDDFARRLPDGTLPASGYDVILGDGQRWRVPVALADAPNYAIPWRETLDDEGRLIREPDRRFERVCRAASILYDHMTGDGILAMPEHDLRLACANALAVNYRLDLDDILLLGLLTSESYRVIVGAILDLPSMQEILRGKKAGAESGISSGEPGSSSATSLPGPTSLS